MVAGRIRERARRAYRSTRSEQASDHDQRYQDSAQACKAPHARCRVSSQRSRDRYRPEGHHRVHEMEHLMGTRTAGEQTQAAADRQADGEEQE